MKDSKSFVIGFLLASSIFLFMGAVTDKLGSNQYKSDIEIADNIYYV